MGISILRIWAIAANSFREVIRDRILYFIGFFALLMAFAWRLLPEIAVGTDEKIFLDLGLAAIGLLGVIVAVFVGTGLINKEIDKRTILVLIPKPLSRMLGVMLVIYLLMLLGMKVSFQALPLIVSVFYLGLELILIAAVAITFGVFTSSIIATLMTFGFYLMGHISKDLIQLGIISKNANILAITKNIYLILPDLERLNFRNEAVYGLLPSADVLMGNALYSLVYTGLLLGISILIFSRRQF